MRPGRPRRPSPLILFLGGFLLVALLSALLLGLPACRTREIPFLDRFFTAVSAVCVTGLTVVDTATAYTRLGQAVILATIQIGGLGIVTLAVWVARSANLTLGYESTRYFRQTFTARAGQDTRVVLRYILLSTFAIEAAGAGLLFLSQTATADPGERLFVSVFHAVSAFCNAGFALWTDNLIGERHNAFYVITIGGLIILGGLGYNVLFELAGKARRPLSNLSLHSKVALATTAALLAGGSALLWLTEQFASSDPTGFTWLDGWFLSVSSRTAGYNIVDTGSLGMPTLLLVILLMYIGASPGSTGGGIKTTTLAILFGTLRSRIRGEESVHFFRRSLKDEDVAAALSLFMLSVAWLSLLTLLLSIAQWQRPDHDLLALSFEAVSAFGTVGLSTGITPHLGAAAKWLLIVLMFSGRLGFLTLVHAFLNRRARHRFRYAREDMMIG